MKNQPTQPDRILSVKEAAGLLNITSNRVRQLCEDGRLACDHFPNGARLISAWSVMSRLAAGVRNLHALLATGRAVSKP